MITNIAVIEDNENFESYGTSPSFPVPDEISRIDLTEYAFIMALTKYIYEEIKKYKNKL